MDFNILTVVGLVPEHSGLASSRAVKDLEKRHLEATAQSTIQGERTSRCSIRTQANYTIFVLKVVLMPAPLILSP
jgi:hypothetical protein